MITVPLKYHHTISQQGSFFRNLRSLGVQVDHSILPTKSVVAPPPSKVSATTARIDETQDDAAAPGIQWEVTENYEHTEVGDSEWTLKARDESALTKAQSLVKEAIESAQAMTHAGFLTLPDRSVFPRIVGTKGANVSRLRAETGADITVGRDNSTIVILGELDLYLQTVFTSRLL